VLFFNLLLAFLKGIASIAFSLMVSASELSILMPIYNKARCLSRSLGSIRNLPLGNHRVTMNM
jgi:hypothetical protein